ncbi:MAG: Rieske 2Fe-2S domain-containing protein [Planctomycetes bacterium]|nr:Rieske 2Fe-2S domain-containing protein [Planctomycetota bacterium]
MTERHKVASIDEIPQGTGKEFVVSGRIVALYHIDEHFYALDGICPHAGGPLAQGKLSGCVVTCPWHGWQFDVTTGQHCLNAQLKQTRFDVVIEGDDVYVEMP